MPSHYLQGGDSKFLTEEHSLYQKKAMHQVAGRS